MLRVTIVDTTPSKSLMRGYTLYRKKSLIFLGRLRYTSKTTPTQAHPLDQWKILEVGAFEGGKLTQNTNISLNVRLTTRLI